MNKELMEALDILEKEKNISKDTLLGAIEQSLIQACKNHFGKADNVHVTINPETCDFSVYAEREVKEFVDDPAWYSRSEAISSPAACGSCRCTAPNTRSSALVVLPIALATTTS